MMSIRDLDAYTAEQERLLESPIERARRAKVVRDHENQRCYASYRGMMSDGASFDCMECHLEGKKGRLVYRGQFRHYDYWTCRRGHIYTDGY